MMLCVISYWVLSGAPQAADSAAKLLRTHPTKTLKWRDVYLKLTRHNGRAGTHGTYNPKHNDRSFNLANSEHIDPERAKGNIYWDCFHGFRSALDPQDPDDLAATFSEVERQFYESRYSNFVESQNERNAKIRHTERNRSIPDLLSSRKTCPEETIYQLGTLDEHASAEDLLNIVTEFIEAFKTKFGEHVHVLDWALHLDESTPHIHERHVFDCENKYGEVAPQQEKALEALGFDLPDPDKPLSRRNNRKITFDAACRKMLFEIAKRHGLELEEEAEYGNRKYLEKQDFILAKQKEQLTAQQNKLDELTLKVSDMENLLENVSAAAYDKAVEVVTDVVRTETRKEDMRMIEDTKKWVLSPERILEIRLVGILHFNDELLAVFALAIYIKDGSAVGIYISDVLRIQIRYVLHNLFAIKQAVEEANEQILVHRCSKNSLETEVGQQADVSFFYLFHTRFI